MSGGVRPGLLERHGVHAIAQPTRRRTIGKHVAKVRVADIADSFDALQKGGAVKAIRDYVGRDRLCERRPPSTGFKLFGGVEKNRVAAQTGINPRLEQAAHLRTERALRPGPAGHAILLGTQLLAPFGVRFLNPVIRSRITVFGKSQYVGPFQCHSVPLMISRREKL